MKLAELRELAKFWQKSLHLKDWTITVSWGTPEEMRDNVGLSWWMPEEAKAEIKILKRCPDQEGVLIHELLHIRIEGHAPYDGVYDILYERSLNDITKTLQTLEMGSR